MKIGFLTRGSELKGSSRVRVLQYVKHLQQSGVQTRVVARPSSPGIFSHALYLSKALRLANWADVVLLQKPNQSKVLVDTLAAFNPRMVVDVDDAIWKSATSGEFERRFRYAISRARFVVAGSETLANLIRELDSNVALTVIPPSVDLDVYHTVKKAEGTSVITIGWIGSSGNLPDLFRILTPLKRLFLSGLTRLRVVSDTPPDIGQFPFDFEAWSLETEVEALLKFDIGIMPLGEDVRSLGRCGYKAIQYMAVGIPVVTSAVGAGLEVVLDSVTGFHAKTEEEWFERLHLLANDAPLRRQMGLNARLRVENCYSITRNLPRLMKIFEDCVQAYPIAMKTSN